MRTEFHAQLDRLTAELGEMCGIAATTAADATTALIHADAAAAGRVRSALRRLDELNGLVDRRAFSLLARHAPVLPEGAHRFERVREYLHDNYMHPVTLDELARVASLSPWHFQRQFKSHFHVTPHQMLMAIRLWRAKGFLTCGMPAAEVAAATGR